MATLYLFGSISPDELLINPGCSLRQLLSIVKALELLTGEPEVQIFFAELRFQEVSEYHLSTFQMQEHNLIIKTAAATYGIRFVLLER